MALEVGSRLGVFEVTGRLGEGGMGVVYRATDTTLQRDVALKVLPDAFATDPERLARFEREAKVLASLNHPNIAQIHGLEQSGDVRALVLELVEGPTLQDRIAKGPIPLDEALPIARQIAEALEAAHEQGIIHRDLKPANVKVKDDGTVKVLDFGLAKALGPELSDTEAANSPTMTMTAAATKAGFIMGTAAYMAPEQAAGTPADRRADLWSFGVVLWEMITGRSLFTGETISHVLAAVLRADPDWESLPGDTPSSVRRLLRRCLERTPKKRLPDAAMARLEIDEADAIPEVAAGPTATAVAQHTFWQRPVPALVVAVALIALGGLAVWALARPASPPSPRLERFALTVPADATLQATGPFSVLALSRDGSKLALRSGPPALTGGQLLLRQIDQVDAELIAGPADVQSPVFSPDGEWIAFFDARANALKRVSIRGGSPLTICPVNGFYGASWAADDSIVFAANDGLYRVPAVGGAPELVLGVDAAAGEVGHGWPDVLPGRPAVLYTAVDAEGPRIRAVALDTGDVVDVVPGGEFPRYVPTGHLIYAVDSTLWAVAFDADRLEAIGDAVPVLEGVASGNFNAVQYSVADDGSLSYVSGGASGNARTFVWVDRAGEETPLPLPPREYLSPRLSPDGRRVAVGVRVPGGSWAVWVFDVVSAAGLQLTHEGNANTIVWTPDGESVVFTWNNPPGGGLWDLHVARADGSGEIRRVTTTPDANEQPTSVTPDGRSILTVQINNDGSRDVWAIPIDGEGEPEVVIRGGGFARGNATVSPDGNWLAYRSDQTGQMEIYLQPYPGPGQTVPVSVGGGDMVIWAADGSELFYRRGTAVMAVTVDGEGAVGRPTELFDSGHFTTPGGTRQYHVAPDERFLMIPGGDAAAGATEARLMLIQNWFEELNALVPTP